MMRLILFSSTHSDDVQATAMVLREVRGYQALSFHELSSPTYQGQGCKASPRATLQNLMLEMAYGAVLVIHPETEPAIALDLIHACRFLRCTWCYLHDLPPQAPVSHQDLDLVLNTLEYLDSRPEALSTYDPVLNKAPKKIPVTSLCLAVDMDADGPVIDRPRTPLEWLGGLWRRWLRWELRFNARYGHVLKNPVSRALMERQAPVRPYKLDTSPPPPVTG